MSAHTKGPWHAGHHTDPTSTCECRSLVSEGYAGSIAIVTKNNGKSSGDGGNDAPPEPEAIAKATP